MKANIEKGINFQQRLSIIKGVKELKIRERILKVNLDGKLRKISNQFKIHTPKISIIEKKESRDK